MEPRKRTDKIEVNLGDIFGLLLHRMWMILLAGFICGAVGFIYSNFFITPQYQSTTKVYILNKQNSTSVTYSDVQLSTTLSKDYEQLVTSRYVIEGVIKQLSLNETYESLVGILLRVLQWIIRVLSLLFGLNGSYLHDKNVQIYDQCLLLEYQFRYLLQ